MAITELENLEKQYDKIFEGIKATDYSLAGVLGAINGLKGEDEKAENDIEEMKEVKAGIDEAIVSIKEYIEIGKTDLNESLYAGRLKEGKSVSTINEKDCFLFPQGTKKSIYEMQLKALKFANQCEENSYNIENAENVFNNTAEKRERVLNGFFKSSVYINADQYSNKNDQILKLHFLNDMTADARKTILEDGGTIGGGEYEEMKKLSNELCAAGIESVVANDVLAKSVNDSVQDQCEKIAEKCAMVKNDCTKGIEKKYPDKHFHIGITVGLLFGIMAILGMFTILIYNVAVRIIVIVVPPVVISGLYTMISLLVDRNLKKEYSQNKELYVQLCHRADELTAQVQKTLLKQLNLYKIYGDADSLMIAHLYEVCKKTAMQARELHTQVKEILDEIHRLTSEATKYLPEKLDRDLLPDIIEAMEDGRAKDYESALRLVK